MLGQMPRDSLEKAWERRGICRYDLTVRSCDSGVAVCIRLGTHSICRLCMTAESLTQD